VIEVVRPTEQHELTIRDILNVVTSLGGNLDTQLQIGADGEPVYIYAYLEENGTSVASAQ
jgi:hypothetical protein